jgi:hypothetical protein
MWRWWASDGYGVLLQLEASAEYLRSPSSSYFTGSVVPQPWRQCLLFRPSSRCPVALSGVGRCSCCSCYGLFLCLVYFGLLSSLPFAVWSENSNFDAKYSGNGKGHAKFSSNNNFKGRARFLRNINLVCLLLLVSILTPRTIFGEIRHLLQIVFGFDALNRFVQCDLNMHVWWCVLNWGPRPGNIWSPFYIAFA